MAYHQLISEREVAASCIEILVDNIEASHFAVLLDPAFALPSKSLIILVDAEDPDAFEAANPSWRWSESQNAFFCYVGELKAENVWSSPRLRRAGNLAVRIMRWNCPLDGTIEELLNSGGLISYYPDYSVIENILDLRNRRTV